MSVRTDPQSGLFTDATAGHQANPSADSGKKKKASGRHPFEGVGVYQAGHRSGTQEMAGWIAALAKELGATHGTVEVEELLQRTQAELARRYPGFDLEARAARHDLRAPADHLRPVLPATGG